MELKKVYHLLYCASSQEVAALLATQGHGDLVVLTEYQSAGRGQQKRLWESEMGKNLLFTCLIQAPNPLLDQEKLPSFVLNMAAALALYDVAKAYLPTSLAKHLKVKWPNDLCFSHPSGKSWHKLGGLLLEMCSSPKAISYLLVGVGLNVNQHHFMHPATTSLALLSGRALPREELLALWQARFVVRAQRGLQSVLASYNKRLLGQGSLQRFSRPTKKNKAFYATLLGVTEQGKLSVKTTQNTILSYHHPAISQCNQR